MTPKSQSSSDSPQSNRGRFAETSWSLVLEAGRSDPERSRKALERLCSLYWYPLYAFVRRSGYGVQEAQDITQGFFERLLARDPFGDLTQGGTRFRTFLLASLKNFMRDEWSRRSAQKRGGGEVPISIDATDADGRYMLEPSHGVSPDLLYDRRWALTLLDLALSELEAEFGAVGKGHLLKRLGGLFLGSVSDDNLRKAAADLQMSVEAVKKVVQRLRVRYLAILRQQIRCTLKAGGPNEEEEELRHLRSILGQ